MPLDPLPYAPPTQRPADRTYAIMLVVLALFYGIGVVTLFSAAQMPTTPPLDPAAKWAVRFSAAVTAFFVVLILATIAVRAFSRSNASLIWTKGFNIFLLLAFPFGTVVGIYGLRKVDKPQIVAGA